MKKPQSPDIQAQLNQARENLQRLGNAVSELVNLSPDVFSDEAIKTRLQDFQQAYEEATQRLANPSFRIATIGTTSSGKSTIVNALMGRRIAPMEAGEMSGGVLTLKHSVDRTLVIEATENAVWETGEWTDINDQQLYDRIQIAMHSYHEARKKKEYIAPQITAHIPLLPACDANLSGLPEGINVEFLDLPGLKSVQDKTNLAILQPLVGKAFSLVALDYMQVDEQHRQKLLTELKRVVEYLQGRTDSMIFILNRVDQRGSDDKPLEERLQQLKTEIQEQLNLPSLPDIIPFNARLLYYAQCAWGTNPLHTSSDVTPEVRSRLLKSLFKDCANFIEYKTDDNFSEFSIKFWTFWSVNCLAGIVFTRQFYVDLDDWFSDIKKSVKRNAKIEDETIQELLIYAFEWSGGKALWECLRLRLKESFSSVVIVPILKPVFDNFDPLISLLSELSEKRQLKDKDNIELAKNKIAEIRDSVKNNVENLEKSKREITSSFQKIIDNPHSQSGEQLNLRKKLGENQDVSSKTIKNLIKITDVVNEIETDLNSAITFPVRDSLIHNLSSFELKDKLREKISPSLAEDIARNYDSVSRIITKFEEKEDFLCRQIKANDEKGKADFKREEQHLRLLYLTIRQGMTARANFKFQANAQDFLEVLESLKNELLSKLIYSLVEQELLSDNLQKSILSDTKKKLSQNPPELPSDLFKFADGIKSNKTKKKEVIGTETKDVKVEKTRNVQDTETYTVGSCFKETKTRPITRTQTYTTTEKRTSNVYGDVEYEELYLPTPQLMAKQWVQGIAQEKEKLWQILKNWIEEQLDIVNQIFTESVKEIIDFCDRILDEQLQIIESELEISMKFWQEVQSKENDVKQINDDFRKDLVLMTTSKDICHNKRNY